MPGRNVRIGRIAGIPVGISPWWLLIVGLLSWSLAVDYFPREAPGLGAAPTIALAVASVLCLFAGILAHELGHAIVARRAGVEIEEIDLWLLGGVARMRGRPAAARDELRFSLAGPAVTTLLAVGFGLLALTLPHSTLQVFLAYQARANAAIAVFNLLPALPLDGGRAARALLWRRTGDFARATFVAARAGRWIGFGLVYAGVVATLAGVVAGVWFAMIGLFLVAAATAEQRLAELMRALDGVTAGEVMSALGDSPGHRPEVQIREDEPVTGLLDQQTFLTSGRAVVVDAAGRPVGVVALDELERHAARTSRAQAQRRSVPR